jgi:hypothetical protein
VNGALAAAAVGAFFLVIGSLARSGHLRQNLGAIQSGDAPFWLRNAPFVLVPAGLALITGASAAAIEAHNGKAGGAAYTTLLVIACVFGLLTALFLIKPPAILKPRWIRDPNAAVGEPLEVGPVRYFAPWVVWIGMVVVFFATGRPIVGVIGLILGGSAVAGMHRRLRR